MSEQKPIIEDDMKRVLHGETLKNVLDFVAFLRENGFTNDDEYNNNFYCEAVQKMRLSFMQNASEKLFLPVVSRCFSFVGIT